MSELRAARRPPDRHRERARGQARPELRFFVPLATRETRDYFESRLYAREAHELPITHPLRPRAPRPAGGRGRARRERHRDAGGGARALPDGDHLPPEPAHLPADEAQGRCCRTWDCPTSSRANSSCPSCCRTMPRPRTSRRRWATGSTTRRARDLLRERFARMHASLALRPRRARRARRSRPISPRTPDPPMPRRHRAPTDLALLCGVDEAGRGPLAGASSPPRSCSIRRARIDGLADSKVLDRGSAREARRAHQGARARVGDRLGDAWRRSTRSTSCARACSRCAARSRRSACSPRRCASTATAAAERRLPLPRDREGRPAGGGDLGRVHPRQDGARCRDGRAGRALSRLRLREPQGLLRRPSTWPRCAASVPARSTAAASSR